MSEEERRTARRVSINLSLREEYLSQEQEVTAVNISEHGMYYLRPNDSSRRTNQEVLLTFSLLDRLQPMKALAWVVDEKEVDGKIESHVTFMFLPDKDEKIIRDFVATQGTQESNIN